MEDKLKKRKARIFRDVHVSGHGGREDLRELVKLLRQLKKKHYQTITKL
jgi:mRNA degradation ribonuclease J1/J2